MGFVQVTAERTEINLSVGEMSSRVSFHRGSSAGCAHRTDITAADDDYYFAVDFSGAKTSRLARAQGKSRNLIPNYCIARRREDELSSDGERVTFAISIDSKRSFDAFPLHHFYP